MKVHIFIPCFIDQLYPQTAFNMIKILNRLGCEVVYNEKQTCCGQPAFNAGFQHEAKQVCTKFINDFKDAEYIIVPSASCTGFVKNYYPGLFDNSAQHQEVLELGKKVYEFTDFLVNVLDVQSVGSTFHAKAAYHDSCAALRECKIKKEPRILLQHVQGLEILDMRDQETCCGFGGTFSVKYEPISIGMADQKVQNALQAGAECIISTDVSCLMHLDGYIRHKNLPLQTMHIADVLASGW